MDIEIVGFYRSQIRDLIKRAGYKFSKKDKAILTKRGKHKSCRCCDRKLKLNNFGHVVPGSTDLLCDNPECINDYVSSLMEKP